MNDKMVLDPKPVEPFKSVKLNEQIETSNLNSPPRLSSEQIASAQQRIAEERKSKENSFSSALKLIEDGKVYEITGVSNAKYLIYKDPSSSGNYILMDKHGGFQGNFNPNDTKSDVARLAKQLMGYTPDGKLTRTPVFASNFVDGRFSISADTTVPNWVAEAGGVQSNDPLFNVGNFSPTDFAATAPKPATTANVPPSLAETMAQISISGVQEAIKDPRVAAKITGPTNEEVLKDIEAILNRKGPGILQSVEAVNKAPQFPTSTGEATTTSTVSTKQQDDVNQIIEGLLLKKPVSTNTK
jgi:hypothetical protein